MSKKDQVDHLLQSGALVEEICTRLQVSSGYVYKRRAALNQAKPHDPVPTKTLIASYQELQSTYAVAERHGLSQTSVYRRLAKAGVSLPSQGRHRKPRGPASHMYKDGLGKVRRKDRRTALHLQVAALCLGFPVPEGWIVHHMDEDPTNNHPSNLWVFQRQADHATYHQKLLANQRAGRAVDASLLASETGGLKLPLPSDLRRFELGIDPSAPSETLWSMVADLQAS